VMNGPQWRGMPWSADSPLPDTVSFAVRLQDDGSVTLTPKDTRTGTTVGPSDP